MVRKRYVRTKVNPHSENLPVFSSQTQTRSRLEITSYPSGTNPGSSPNLKYARRTKMHLCRAKLQAISLLLVITSVGLSVGNRCVQGFESPAVVTGMTVVSLLQVWLLISYWRQTRKYALMISKATATTLTNDAKLHRLGCLLECVYHLIVPFPREFIVAGMSVNSMINVMIVVRNYHIFRWMYWMSAFSSLRGILYAYFLGMKSRVVYHYYLWKWGVAAVGVTLFSLYLYLETFTAEDVAEVQFKAVVRLGEGQNFRFTAGQQISALLWTGLGIYLLAVLTTAFKQELALTDSQTMFAAHLLGRMLPVRPKIKAVVLIQAWWRLIRMRRRRRLNLSALLTWYHTLLTLSSRKSVTSNTHDGYSLISHVAAFEEKLKKNVKRIQPPTSLLRRLDSVLRQEGLLLRRILYISGQPQSLVLPRRLSTVYEVLSEQSSPILKSPLQVDW